MLERFELLIGKENIEKIKKSNILVVGVGGVGGYVIEALARSGVGKLILIDYDIISISNKNRQIIATDDTIGEKKVEAFKKRIESISKECEVLGVDVKLNPENISLLDNYKIDYIVDACDTVSTKEALIEYTLKKKIPFISSMGTGNRLDPSKLEIMDIRKTDYDPLARKLRKFVRDKNIHEKIMVVTSREQPIKTGSKTIASCSFVPSTAGLLIASYIIRQIISRD